LGWWNLNVHFGHSPVVTPAPIIRRRKLIGDYIPYRRLIVYYAVFEREGVVCEWL